MNVLASRARIAAKGGVERTAQRFFELLAKKRIAEAQELTSSSLRWFGKDVVHEMWRGSFARFFSSRQLTVGKAREVSLEIASLAPEDRRQELFDGPISGDMHLFLVDIAVDGREVTALVMIGGKDKRIERVVEPTAFAAYLAERASR